MCFRKATVNAVAPIIPCLSELALYAGTVVSQVDALMWVAISHIKCSYVKCSYVDSSIMFTQ